MNIGKINEADEATWNNGVIRMHVFLVRVCMLCGSSSYYGFREAVGTVWGKFRKQHCFSRQYLFYDLSTIPISIHPTVFLLVFITSFESITGAIPIAIMRKVTEKVA